MTTLAKFNQNSGALDLLFKNFFNTDSFFSPIVETKIGFPVDIFETSSGLHFEVACTGLSKEDVNISIENDVLRISHQSTEKESEDTPKYFHRGISKRSFNFGYRIPSRFDMSNANAEMKNGLLNVTIPFAEQSQPKQLLIK